MGFVCPGKWKRLIHREGWGDALLLLCFCFWKFSTGLVGLHLFLGHSSSPCLSGTLSCQNSFGCYHSYLSHSWGPWQTKCLILKSLSLDSPPLCDPDLYVSVREVSLTVQPWKGFSKDKHCVDHEWVLDSTEDLCDSICMPGVLWRQKGGEKGSIKLKVPSAAPRYGHL